MLPSSTITYQAPQPTERHETALKGGQFDYLRPVRIAEAKEIDIAELSRKYPEIKLPPDSPITYADAYQNAELTYFYARKWGVNHDMMYRIVGCETGWQFDHTMRSLATYKDGTRENSWGLAQWHLPAKNVTKDGQVITKEIATDPHQSLDAMAWHISEGRAGLWSCYHILKKEGVIHTSI